MKPIFLLLSMTALAGAASWQTELEEAQRQSAAGQAAAAEIVYKRVMADTEGLTPAELNAAGLQFYYLSRNREAESLYLRSLSAWDKLGPTAARDRAVTALNLGTLLRTEGRYPEAETLILDCLRRAETAAGPESLDAGRATSSLAALYNVWGRLAEAESLAVHANFIFDAQNVRGADRINNRRTLASVYIAEKHFDRAEAMLRPLLEGQEDRLTAGIYNDLAVAALDQHHLAEAESLSRKALDAAERLLPAAHPVHAAVLNNLAQTCRFQGRFLEAERYYRQAISILEDSLGRQHPETAKALMNLAAFYHQRGREAGAEDLYRQVARIFESAYGMGDPLTLVARNELADVLRAEGRFTESGKLGPATLASLEAELGPQDSRLIQALANYARLLDNTKRSKEAAALRTRIQGMSEGFRATP